MKLTSYKINIFSFIFIGLGVAFCLTGKVDWYVFLLIVLSTIELNITIR